MRLVIDDRAIEIPDEMVDDAFGLSWSELMDAYASLDDTLRMGAKMFARHVLKELEKKHGLGVRPAKGDDPVIHLVALMYNFTAEVLKRYASVTITTEDAVNPTAATLGVSFSGPGEGWRQMVTSRQNGVREDNILEASVETLDEIVPNIETLYIGQ